MNIAKQDEDLAGDAAIADASELKGLKRLSPKTDDN